VACITYETPIRRTEVAINSHGAIHKVSDSGFQADVANTTALLEYGDMLLRSVKADPFNETSRKLLEQVKTIMYDSLGPEGSMYALHEEAQKELNGANDAIVACNAALNKVMNGIVAEKKATADKAKLELDASRKEEAELLKDSKGKEQALTDAMSSLSVPTCPTLPTKRTDANVLAFFDDNSFKTWSANVKAQINQLSLASKLALQAYETKKQHSNTLETVYEQAIGAYNGAYTVACEDYCYDDKKTIYTDTKERVSVSVKKRKALHDAMLDIVAQVECVLSGKTDCAPTKDPAGPDSDKWDLDEPKVPKRLTDICKEVSIR